MQESSILQNNEKLEELKSEAKSQQQKVVNKWKSKVENSKTDKKLTKDRSDEPPKLAKTKKTNFSSESVAKKWKSKLGGAVSQNQSRRQPPSAASARWASARSKTLAVSKLGSIAKQPGGGGAGMPSRSGSAMPNKPMQSNSAPSSSMSRSATLANRPSALQSNSMKSTFPSSTASKPAISAPKATWQKAAMKTKAVNNFSKPSTSAVGAKKPYVPYKPPAKQAAGVKPGVGGKGGKGGPVKFGGGKMGGRLF